MDWARKRQLFVIGILFIIGALLSALLFVVFTIEKPTCFDGVQNGSETGIDCGGGCELVCSLEARPLVVSFAQYVQTDGRPDVVAHIVNQNSNADAISANYTFEVYTGEGDLFARHSGTLDVPHNSTRAVFIPRISSISPNIARAFLTITDTVFHTAQQGPRLSVKSFAWSNISTEPVLRATVSGDTEESLRRIPLVVTVFDAENTVVGVSQTIVDSISANGEKEVVFTWNSPFEKNPTRVEFIFDTPRTYGDA